MNIETTVNLPFCNECEKPDPEAPSFLCCGDTVYYHGVGGLGIITHNEEYIEAIKKVTPERYHEFETMKKYRVKGSLEAVE